MTILAFILQNSTEDISTILLLDNIIYTNLKTTHVNQKCFIIILLVNKHDLILFFPISGP